MQCWKSRKVRVIRECASIFGRRTPWRGHDSQTRSTEKRRNGELVSTLSRKLIPAIVYAGNKMKQKALETEEWRSFGSHDTINLHQFGTYWSILIFLNRILVCSIKIVAEHSLGNAAMCLKISHWCFHITINKPPGCTKSPLVCRQCDYYIHYPPSYSK